ncbi:MAG: hypothetical protein P1P93_10580 [Gammaproteobacteria bacterium]|nr:hypothetical protein [Gammaproteobacteria bacterium]
MMAKTEITLVIPDLAPIFEQEINSSIIPPQLSTVIRKAQFTQHSDNVTRLLTQLFSSDEVRGRDLPLASLRADNSIVLCADPCYLHADRDQLLLFSGDLVISDDDAEHIINIIQPLLADYDATLVKQSNEQWLLQLKTMPDLEFTALAEVSGKAVQSALPTGQQYQRQAWIRLWNEIQMSLFELPVNKKRQQQGLLPINSLWFWGKGDLSLRSNYWQTVMGQHYLLKQLADKSDTDYLPDIDITAINQQSGRYLMVLERLDLEGDWQTQLADIAASLQHLWQQLKWRKIDRLTIEIPNYGQFELTPFSCWKLW